MSSHAILQEYRIPSVSFRHFLFVRFERREKDTYIPHDYRTWRPFQSNLEVLPESYVIVEELEEMVTFFLLVADDPACDC